MTAAVSSSAALQDQNNPGTALEWPRSRCSSGEDTTPWHELCTPTVPATSGVVRSFWFIHPRTRCASVIQGEQYDRVEGSCFSFLFIFFFSIFGTVGVYHVRVILTIRFIYMYIIFVRTTRSYIGSCRTWLDFNCFKQRNTPRVVGDIDGNTNKFIKKKKKSK
jgi:hypothetical protein